MKIVRNGVLVAVWLTTILIMCSIFVTTSLGQDMEHCRNKAPQFDLSTQDPFAAIRYQNPPEDMVPPFAACKKAYMELMSTRPLCDDVKNVRTLLVSQKGSNDPRWKKGGIGAVFTTIQEAIDAANHCDKIIVRPGTYNEYLVIEGKDVQIFSDTWNEDCSTENGNERVNNYVAERIDLLHYYSTGERIIIETHTPYLKPLKRATRTVLEGGGFAEGPNLGGKTRFNEDNPIDPNLGCGNRRPMVNFIAGTTRNTIFDGFSVRLMPQQDHTIPGHGHTLQCRGGSPIIRHNIIYNNGSTGAGVHASWQRTSPLKPPCEYDPSLAQETFRNDDFRNTNIQYRPVPLIYDNISYQNNGLGLGNNHYSCGVMINNESFWNAVPGEEASHQSPGIGTRHGAKTHLEYNIVYENAWTGIGVRQGYLQPKKTCKKNPSNCNHINERTQSVILHNIVFKNGFGKTLIENQGGISLDGAGLPDEPVLVQGNIVYESKVSGIGVRNRYAGKERGFVMDDTYALIVGNTVFNNARQGVTCKGSDYGKSHCTIVGNDSYWNQKSGIGFAKNATGYILNNVAACNSKAGIVTKKAGGEIPILNNIVYFNKLAGILNAGSKNDYNILSGNKGQKANCGDGSRKNGCKKPQYGGRLSGSTSGANDIFVDPLFKNPLKYNYTLLNSSPAIDSGVDISLYYRLWEIKGRGPDRGSHEK